MQNDIADLVDLERFPIHDPRGKGRALVEECRRQLGAIGAYNIDDFLRPEAIRAMVAEAKELEPLAHRTRGNKGTAYLEAPDESLPEDHPRRRMQTTSVGAIAYDLVPAQSALRRLYESPVLIDFLTEALGLGPLHRYADPLGALNIAVMGDGEHLMWHFDQADFVVSILLQDCEQGGDFEFVPNIRRPGEENYGKVKRLLDGDHSEVVRLDAKPGTLALFQGRHSIHRVSPIEGRTPRYIALLGYDTKPGTMSSDRLKQRRYGRIHPKGQELAGAAAPAMADTGSGGY
jgi:2OG-Fe(II) oxygenase superfamily